MWDRHFSDKGIMNHSLTLKIWISIRDDGKRTRANKFTYKPSPSAKRTWVSISRDTVPQFQFQGISSIALDTVLFSFSYWSRLIRIRARPAQTWLNLTTKWFFRNSNRDIIQPGMLYIFSIDTDAIFFGSLARPIAKGALSEPTKSKQLLFRKLISVD